MGKEMCMKGKQEYIAELRGEKSHSMGTLCLRWAVGTVGMKEMSTGLPVSKSYSWKAPEESYKVFEAAIAASALRSPGVQQKRPKL